MQIKNEGEYYYKYTTPIEELTKKGMGESKKKRRQEKRNEATIIDACIACFE